jgi:signal transduction histidine kinase
MIRISATLAPLRRTGTGFISDNLKTSLSTLSGADREVKNNQQGRGSAAHDCPPDLQAETFGGVFEISVSNTGDPIPPSAQQHLFRPFFRGAAQSGKGGLGLGLYNASEIAKVHGGTLAVASSPDETRFTFRMPLDQPAAMHQSASPFSG